MDLSRLDDLKERLTSAEQLGDIWDYFFDHFGENPDFIALGKLKRVPLVRDILRKVAKELFGEGAELRTLRLTVIREKKLAHGTCLLAGRLTSVLYFGDVGMGSLAVTDQKTGMTHFVRFTKMGIVPASESGEGPSTPVPPGGRLIN